MFYWLLIFFLFQWLFAWLLIRHVKKEVRREEVKEEYRREINALIVAFNRNAEENISLIERKTEMVKDLLQKLEEKFSILQGLETQRELAGRVEAQNELISRGLSDVELDNGGAVKSGDKKENRPRAFYDKFVYSKPGQNLLNYLEREKGRLEGVEGKKRLNSRSHRLAKDVFSAKKGVAERVKELGAHGKDRKEIAKQLGISMDELSFLDYKNGIN